MKLTLPLPLRRALVALCLLCATPAFSEEIARTEINDNTSAQNTLFNETAENVTMNFTGDGTDYFPASSPTSYDDILVLSWINGDGHGGNRTYTFEGKIHGDGNIVGWNKNSGDGGQTYVFNGDMAEFTGDISSGVRGLTLKFGGDARTSVSGTGAISITHHNKGITYEVAAGNSTITNSSITTNTLDFNGGAGVNYAVSSAVSATTALNIAADTSVNFSATVSTAALTIGSGANLTVAASGSLTIDGALSLFSSINNEGAVTFGNNATVDLSNLSGITTDQTTTYTLVSGGSINFGDLDWTSFTGILGLSATSHNIAFDNTAGTVSFTLLAANMSFAGSSDMGAPAGLNWAVGGEMVFTEGETAVAFEDGASVTFTGHTAATLTEDINAYQVTVAEEGSLSIDEAGFSLAVGSIVLENDSDLIFTSELDAGEVNLDHLVGSISTTLTLSASAEGTTLNLAGFEGTLNLKEGSASTSLADFDSFTAVHLTSGASYAITDVLASGDKDLSIVTGEFDTILSIKGIGDLSDSGNNSGDRSTLTLSADFTGTLEVMAGLVALNGSYLGGTSSIIMTNGGIVGNQGSGTLTFDKDIQITSGATGYARVYGTGRALDLTGAIYGDSSTTLAQTDGGTVSLSGDMSSFEGTIAVRGYKVIANSDIEFAKSVLLSSGKTFEVAAGVIVATLGDYNTEDGSYTAYQRRTGHDYTITVNADAEFNDNVHLRQADGSVTVNGGGVYTIESYVGGDLTGDSTLTIAADTTMEVLGTTESNGVAARAAAFALTYNQAGTVDVNGTLILNSGISNQDAEGEINVNEGGTLELREGLYGATQNGTINVNVADTATLKLSNQTQESYRINDAATNIVTNIAAGATITAMSEETNILNTLSLSGTGKVKVTADAGVTKVNFQDVISNVAGSSAGLEITGQAGQTFTFSAANTYTGDTDITTASVVAGSATAFGDGGTVTLNSGSLDLGGHAVANTVIAASGKLSGFDSFAGSLEVRGAAEISGTYTGYLSVSSTGSLNMEGTWDYSSAIIIGETGSVTFDTNLLLDLTDIDFDQNGDEYSLRLFTGTGSANINTWLSGGVVDMNKITGLDSSISALTYSNGTLSYTVMGDIHIDAHDKAFFGQTDVNIIFDEGSEGRAQLNTGFSQGADSSFSGRGSIYIVAGADVTLDNASADFSGLTNIVGSLTIKDDLAMGKSMVILGSNGVLTVDSGVTMSNDATLAGNAKVNVGVLTITGQGDGGYISGDDKKLSHTSATESSITGATLTDTKVTLATGGSASITDSTLTNTYVQLEDQSTLTLTNVHQGLGSTLNNNEATVILNDHTIDENVGAGTLTSDLATLEGGTEKMLVYSLTSLNVQTTIINDSLTLNLIITDEADFTAQMLNGMVAFELTDFTLGGGSLDVFNLNYTDVNITVRDGSLTGSVLYTGTALGTTTLENGNMALYIPEPSTASLSLLALAGLLARRRRKQA